MNPTPEWIGPLEKLMSVVDELASGMRSLGRSEGEAAKEMVQAIRNHLTQFHMSPPPSRAAEPSPPPPRNWASVPLKESHKKALFVVAMNPTHGDARGTLRKGAVWKPQDKLSIRGFAPAWGWDVEKAMAAAFSELPWVKVEMVSPAEYEARVGAN
jgi:hypothetical protein